MFLGLLITAGTALVVSSSPALVSTIFVEYRFVFWAIVLAQFGLVVYLSARVTKMAPATASALFLLYSALDEALLRSKAKGAGAHGYITKTGDLSEVIKHIRSRGLLGEESPRALHLHGEIVGSRVLAGC